jgi:PIN domain nuclease of toxin-antitoxin system
MLQGEKGSEKLQALQPEGIVSAVNVAEVLAKLVSHGMPLPDAQHAFNALHLEIVPFGAALATTSARYVHEGISLGDRCFLAAAHHFGSGWTSDRALPKLLGSAAPHLEFFR